MKKILTLMIAAATIFAACSKDDDTPIQQHDTEIIYIPGDHQTIAPEVIKSHTDSVELRYLYIVPHEGQIRLSTPAITNTINNRFKPAFAVSNKVKGKGNFDFENPVLSADSLWMVQQGWTVNQ
jgi:ABC-type glycerol-3-phosphate transport system substrate-binding protein